MLFARQGEQVIVVSKAAVIELVSMASEGRFGSRAHFCMANSSFVDRAVTEDLSVAGNAHCASQTLNFHGCQFHTS